MQHHTDATAARPANPKSKPEDRPAPLPGALTYTLHDAARLSGLSRSTLYCHESAGRLQMVTVGGRTLVSGSSLRRLLGVDE